MDRFWARVDRRGPDECWPWLGSRNGKGYGTISWEGRPARATHVAIALARMEIVPPGMMVCHTCDNPPCVNPKHLWVGTRSDNMRDAVKKGRAYHLPQPCCPKCGGPYTQAKRQRYCRACESKRALASYHRHKHKGRARNRKP